MNPKSHGELLKVILPHAQIPNESDDPVTAAVSSILLDTVDSLRIGEVVVGVEALPGDGPDRSAIPLLIVNPLRRELPLNWKVIANTTVETVQGWRGVGAEKTRKLLEWLARTVLAHHLTNQSTIRAQQGEPAEHPTVDALADSVLATFDSRSRAILVQRVLACSRPPTLEKLAREFGVTRERVRQLEKVAIRSIDAMLAESNYIRLRAEAADIATQIGRAAPLDLCPASVRVETSSARLLSYLAGPYHSIADWLSRDRNDPKRVAIALLSEHLGARGFTESQALDVLLEAGFVEPVADRLLGTLTNLRRVDGLLVVWPSTWSARAKLLLSIRGESTSSVELARMADVLGNLRSFRGAIQADPDIVRVGRDSYALGEWGYEEYKGVVPAMVDALSGGTSRSVDELASTLSERYAISPTSVMMNAGIHPVFVMDGTAVRLRRSDEPYRPKTALAQESSCFIIEGTWALRITVDYDLLRGSGRTIPEPFAVHLGVEPGESMRLLSEFGDIHIGWLQQPHIGSLRRAALGLGLDYQDHLFARRADPNSLEFTGVTKKSVSMAPPETAITLLAGQTGPIDDPWDLVLGKALGLSEPVEPAHLRPLLELRGNADLVELVEILAPED